VITAQHPGARSWRLDLAAEQAVQLVGQVLHASSGRAGLHDLLLRRPDLCGVHPLADLLDQQLTWSA